MHTSMKQRPMLLFPDGGSVAFDGATFDPAADGPRLAGLLQRVHDAMKSGGWFTLAELAERCGGSEPSVSARIRDMRKAKFGSHTILRRPRGERKRGIWEYSLKD